MRKYGYKYDGLNRLNASLYIKPKNSLQRGIDLGSYNEHITYDKNGNINTLFRNGDLDSNLDVIEIDDLDYVYDGGNKLLKVMDNSNHPEGFKDGTNSGNDYSYDDFGNMTQDLNKGINSITYNHLNLPKKITYSTSSQNISYLYNALGVKVQKKVFKSGIVGTFNPDHTVTTDYLSGFHYEFNDNPNLIGNNGMVFFATSEGYVNVTLGKFGNPTYNYVYNYTDHLGNVRVSYTNGTGGAATILEENHYYPFGLKHKKYGSTVKNFVEIEDGDGYYVGVETVPPGARKTYQYKYNGKEFQDELNLNMYAMDMRQYDPAIARWVVQDPVIHHSMSPYNAFDNNPVFWADPSGGNSISYALSNIDWSQVGLNYNWDSGTYSFFGEEVSNGFAMNWIEMSQNKDLSITGTGEGGGGSGGEASNSSYLQQGKEVTLKSLGIDSKDSAETIISKILSGMKPGDYVSGDMFSFINSEVGDYIKTVTRVDATTFKIKTKGILTGAALKNNSTLTITSTEIEALKIAGVYKITLNGLTSLGKTQIYQTVWVNDNIRYMYEDKKWIQIKIK